MKLKYLSLVLFLGLSFSSAILAEEEALEASGEGIEVQEESQVPLPYTESKPTQVGDGLTKLKNLSLKVSAYLKAKENIVPEVSEVPLKETEEAPAEAPPLAFTKKGMYALTSEATSIHDVDGTLVTLEENKIVSLLEKTATEYLIEYNGYKGYLEKAKVKGYTPEALGKKVNEVPYISQLYPVYAPNGCEPTSMLMGLKAKGYTDIDLKTYLDKMPKHPSNPKLGYVGQPYNTEYHRFQTIDPKPLAAYGKTYGARTESLEGEPIESVIREVQNGNTVVLWATLYWQKPQYSTLKIDGVPTRRIFNNHVLLVTGYDPKKQAFYIADPYNHERLGANRKKPYYYWKSLKEVDTAYNYDNRRFAVVVR